MSLYTQQQLAGIMNRTSAVSGIKVADLTANGDFRAWASPILTQPRLFNRFVTTLIDQFVYRATGANMFTSAFDYFRETRDGAGRGSYETVVNPVFPMRYDMTAFDRVLDFYPNDTLVQYFAINREDTFPQTITRKEARKAFTSFVEMDNFLEQLIVAPRNGNVIIENNLIKEMLNANVASGAIKHENYTKPTTKAEWEALAQRIQQIAIGMCAEPTTKYNNYGNLQGAKEPAWTQAQRDDLVIIADAEFISSIRTYVLALAYDKNEIDFKYHFVTVDDLGYNEYNYLTRKFGAHHDSLFDCIICSGGFIKLEDNYESDLTDENIFTRGVQRAINIEQTYGIRAWEPALALVAEGTVLESLTAVNEDEAELANATVKLTLDETQATYDITTTPNTFEGDYTVKVNGGSIYTLDSSGDETVGTIQDSEGVKAVAELALVNTVVDDTLSLALNMSTSVLNPAVFTKCDELLGATSGTVASIFGTFNAELIETISGKSIPFVISIIA